MLDRAYGALLGLAIGDALGMPAQGMSRAAIQAEYGPVRGLLPAGSHQLIAAGLPAGSVTDDTEQALLLARLLVEGAGHVDPAAFAEALIQWERTMAAKGSLDLLGPSTKRAVERIAAGVPAVEAGRDGATNGAAMRVTPVGVAYRPDPVERLVDAAVEASLVTHNTTIGLGSAAAVAAAVSVGIEGGSAEDMIAIAVSAADLAAERGHVVLGEPIGSRIAWGTRHLRSIEPDGWIDEIDAVIGTDVAAEQSVVAAFALFAVAPSAWDAVCLAASVGGDTDTIAAIAGALAGAQGGASVWPRDVADSVLGVNALDLKTVATDLLRLRRLAASTVETQ
jgi:ADP-ribosylglycohydrolase